MSKVLINSAAIRKKDLVVNDGDLNVVEGSSIAVFDLVTGQPAIIYSPDDESVLLENPFTADDSGQFSFHVENGIYQINATTVNEIEELTGSAVVDVRIKSERLTLFVDFIVNDNTLSAAEANKSKLDSAIAQAETGGYKWICPKSDGDVYIKGSTFFPAGIAPKTLNLSTSCYKIYDTGNIADYNHTFSDGLTLELFFVFGDGVSELLPAPLDTKGGNRYFQCQGQVDDKLAEGDIVCIYNTDDYSWGNFRRVNNPDGTVDYSQSTCNDDRPYYRQGELLEVRTVTAPTTTAPSIPNAVFVKGVTRDNYIAGANIEAHKLAMFDYEFNTLNVEGIENVSITPVMMRQCGVNTTLNNVTVKNGKDCIQMMNCYGVTGYGIKVDQSKLTQDSEAYGVSLRGCLEVRLDGKFYATRHALTHTASFGFSIPSRDCFSSGTFKSYRSYAVDFHGCSENNIVKGTAIGGVVYSGINNDISGLLIIDPYDGIAVFSSEIPKWSQSMGDIRIAVPPGQLMSRYGLINFGGTGLRGFCPNVSEPGKFTIGNVFISFENPVSGSCALPNSGYTQAECEAAGGIYNASTGVCVISDISDYDKQSESTCTAAGGTWSNNLNVINITARNLIADLEISIGNVVLVNSGEITQSGILCRALNDNDPYQGIPPLNVKKLEVLNLTSKNAGGLVTRLVDEVILNGSHIDGGVKGIDCQNYDYLGVHNCGVYNVAEKALSAVNAETGTSECKIDIISRGCGSALDAGEINDKVVFIDKNRNAEIIRLDVESTNVEPFGESGNVKITYNEQIRLVHNSVNKTIFDMSRVGTNRVFRNVSYIESNDDYTPGKYAVDETSNIGKNLTSVGNVKIGETIEIVKHAGFALTLNAKSGETILYNGSSAQSYVSSNDHLFIMLYRNSSTQWYLVEFTQGLSATNLWTKDNFIYATHNIGAGVNNGNNASGINLSPQQTGIWKNVSGQDLPQNVGGLWQKQ